MQRVRTSNLIPGMITSEDVYSYNNQLIVPKGTVLNDKVITRLEFYSVLAIHVEDEIATSEKNTSSSLDSDTIPNPFGTVKEVSFSDIPEKLSYSERIKETTQFKEFKKNFLSNTEALKGNLRAVIDNNTPINIDSMMKSVTDTISEGSTSIGIFDMLHNMRNYDDLTYVHSMNVSIICNIFGQWLGLNDDDLKILTMAGLLHDIGKILIPEEIIKKPSKLTDAEYNIIKTHTLQGYSILKGQPIDERIKNAALLHHERSDGSGYPLGYDDEKIPEYAKIVSIADVYDAMTAARVYRGPLCPFKVVSIFEAEGFQKYNSRLILTFLEHVCQTYINNRVKLSDGTIGDIIMLNRNSLSKPVIKTLDGEVINLEEKRDITIESLI